MKLGYLYVVCKSFQKGRRALLPILTCAVPHGLGSTSANTLTMAGICGPTANIPWLMAVCYCASERSSSFQNLQVTLCTVIRRLHLPGPHSDPVPHLSKTCYDTQRLRIKSQLQGVACRPLPASSAAPSTVLASGPLHM